jgi:hypothetical protein
MARQGYLLKDAEVHNIVSLLGSTDMTICDIAVRMNCSRTAVSSVNRKFQVRDYTGHRTLSVLKAPNTGGYAHSRPDYCISAEDVARPAEDL